MSEVTGGVDSEHLRRAAERLRDFKAHTYTLMRIGPGSLVLDVGCGPGTDTLALARLVQPNGRVVGVDTDPKMLSEADTQARAKGILDSVEHRLADAAALPFDAASFDACRAERLFQVLPPEINQESVFTEMVRVTRTGGWIVAADADWGTASLDHPDTDVERRLVRFFAEQLRPNGYAGRQLLRLARASDLRDIQVEAFGVTFAAREQAPHAGPGVVNAALSAGVVTESDAERWRAGLAEREAAGAFFGTVTMIIVAGRKEQW